MSTNITPDSFPTTEELLEKPRSFGAKALNFTSIALMAAATVFAVSAGVLALPTIALITASALTFVGGKVVDYVNKRDSADTTTHQQPLKNSAKAYVEASIDQGHTKQWVDVTKKPEQQNSRSM